MPVADLGLSELNWDFCLPGFWYWPGG